MATTDDELARIQRKVEKLEERLRIIKDETSKKRNEVTWNKPELWEKT